MSTTYFDLMFESNSNYGLDLGFDYDFMNESNDYYSDYYNDYNYFLENEYELSYYTPLNEGVWDNIKHWIKMILNRIWEAIKNTKNYIMSLFSKKETRPFKKSGPSAEQIIEKTKEEIKKVVNDEAKEGENAHTFHHDSHIPNSPEYEKEAERIRNDKNMGLREKLSKIQDLQKKYSKQKVEKAKEEARETVEKAKEEAREKVAQVAKQTNNKEAVEKAKEEAREKVVQVAKQEEEKVAQVAKQEEEKVAQVKKQLSSPVRTDSGSNKEEKAKIIEAIINNAKTRLEYAPLTEKELRFLLQEYPDRFKHMRGIINRPNIIRIINIICNPGLIKKLEERCINSINANNVSGSEINGTIEKLKSLISRYKLGKDMEISVEEVLNKREIFNKINDSLDNMIESTNHVMNAADRMIESIEIKNNRELRNQIYNYRSSIYDISQMIQYIGIDIMGSIISTDKTIRQVRVEYMMKSLKAILQMKERKDALSSKKDVNESSMFDYPYFSKYDNYYDI